MANINLNNPIGCTYLELGNPSPACTTSSGGMFSGSIITTNVVYGGIYAESEILLNLSGDVDRTSLNLGGAQDQNRANIFIAGQAGSKSIYIGDYGVPPPETVEISASAEGTIASAPRGYGFLQEYVYASLEGQPADQLTGQGVIRDTTLASILGVSEGPTGQGIIRDTVTAQATGQTSNPEGSAFVVGTIVLSATGQIADEVVGELTATKGIRFSGVAYTEQPQGSAQISIDPFLLSDTAAVIRPKWKGKGRTSSRLPIKHKQSGRQSGKAVLEFSQGDFVSKKSPPKWGDSKVLNSQTEVRWNASQIENVRVDSGWNAAYQHNSLHINHWQEAHPLLKRVLLDFENLDRLTKILYIANTTALLNTKVFPVNIGPALMESKKGVPRWGPAGLPKYIIKIGSIPDTITPQGRNPNIYLCLATPGNTNIYIGPPCSLNARGEVPFRYLYHMQNIISVVRLPDRTPLPCVDFTIKTDCDSWCWDISGELFGPQAWSLVEPVAPNYYPYEIEVTINGWVWKFLLDIPTPQNKFADTSVSFSGRSTSTWLQAPYQARTTGIQSNTYTANQLGEQALANTGWSLIWNLVDWSVPGGIFSYQDASPIERLIQLAKPVDGCIYTHPNQPTITVYPRYPTPAFWWDFEVADLAIPDSVILNVQKEYEFETLYNAVRVGGTIAGVAGKCYIAGTAGDLELPPVTDILICDSSGVAARARGEAELSVAGPGYSITATIPLTAAGDPLGLSPILPGTLIQIEGETSRVRSLTLTPNIDSGKVLQTIVSERRLPL
jgi:hypothetical protein